MSMKQLDDNPLSDKRLDALLATYRISVDSGEQAVDAMLRAARIRAVTLKAELESRGFFGLIAQIFGFRRAAAAAWSALAGMMFAAVIGVSLGASDHLTMLDETAFSIDFDSVIGSGTVMAPSQVEQD
jgi:hypothetical protein